MLGEGGFSLNSSSVYQTTTHTSKIQFSVCIYTKKRVYGLWEEPGVPGGNQYIHTQIDKT